MLRPGGTFVFKAWDTLEHNELTSVVVEELARMFPDDPPQFMSRTPHGYTDRTRIRADVSAAGFGVIEIETVAKRSVGRSARDVAIGFIQGTPLRTEIEARNPARLAEATERAAEAIAARFATGTVDGKIQAIVVTAQT